MPLNLTDSLKKGQTSLPLPLRPTTPTPTHASVDGLGLNRPGWPDGHMRHDPLWLWMGPMGIGAYGYFLVL